MFFVLLSQFQALPIIKRQFDLNDPRGKDYIEFKENGGTSYSESEFERLGGAPGVVLTHARELVGDGPCRPGIFQKFFGLAKLRYLENNCDGSYIAHKVVNDESIQYKKPPPIIQTVNEPSQQPVAVVPDVVGVVPNPALPNPNVPLAYSTGAPPALAVPAPTVTSGPTSGPVNQANPFANLPNPFEQFFQALAPKPNSSLDLNQKAKRPTFNCIRAPCIQPDDTINSATSTSSSPNTNPTSSTATNPTSNTSEGTNESTGASNTEETIKKPPPP